MEPIKTSPNVEFDIIYADGTRTRVKEGILFAAVEDRILFHNGTSRATVLFAAAETALMLIDDIGLLRLFDQHIRSDPESSDTIRILTELNRKTPQTNSAEKQAIFRLGQMDMRESIVNMLTDAADGTSGFTRAVLRIVVDKIKAMEVL